MAPSPRAGTAGRHRVGPSTYAPGVARLPRPIGVASRLGLALLISVLSGVLVAGLAAPVVAGVGLAARSSADNFLALPTDLETPALATRSTVLAADGSVLATFYRVNRVEAPLATIPFVMRQAIIAIEDSRFYEHNGVDYKGIARAAIRNTKSGGVSQGASTLTQQYVKNALLDAATTKTAQDAARADTVDRKLREARYALALEQKLGKDEILHRYLDIAYFGNNVYGVGTAANYYFNKPVTSLTLSESAILAGVVQQPTRYDVASKDPAVLADLKNRRDTVLGRMRDLGYITEAARAETAASPLPAVNPVKLGQDCGAAGISAPFFCDYVRHELEDTAVGAVLGKTKEERQSKLFNGGLVVKTTLDPRMQAAGQTAVDSNVPNGDPSGVGAVDTMVEPGSGAIRVMAVDRPYGEDKAAGQLQINLATGGTQGVQAGSTFKAFFLAVALQQGLPLSTQFVSPQTYYSPANGCAKADRGRPAAVSNAGDSEAGTFDLRSGTADSVNTFYAQVAERTGLEKPLALAESLGVHQVAAKDGKLPRVCTAYLGSAGVSPLAMAGAYAAFAAHGVYCPPRAVVEVDGPDGKPLAIPANACNQALEAGVADTVTSVLTGVITGGTGTAAALGRPAAGKTGTTNDNQAAWFVGYVPQMSSAVWMGHVPNPAPMRGIRIKGQFYREIFGGTLPAPIWKQAMLGAIGPLPAKAFTAADPNIVAGAGTGPTAGVPDVTGRAYADAAALLTAAGFTPAAGRSVASGLPAGRVVYTSPRAGRSAPTGATIYVYRSTGVRPAPSAPATTPAPVVPPVVPPAAPAATVAPAAGAGAGAGATKTKGGGPGPG